MYWIVENIDNRDLGSVLSQLGGRHIIYGVSEGEYKSFAEAVCECFKDIMTPKVFKEEMAVAWEETLIGLSELMVRAGEITKTGFKYEITFTCCILHHQRRATSITRKWRVGLQLCDSLPR